MSAVAFITMLCFSGLIACQSSAEGYLESGQESVADPVSLECSCSNSDYSVAPTVIISPCPNSNWVNVGPGSTLLIKVASRPSRSLINWFVDNKLNYQQAPNGDMDEILINVGSGENGDGSLPHYSISYSAMCIHGRYVTPLGMIQINVSPFYPVYHYRPIVQP